MTVDAMVDLKVNVADLVKDSAQTVKEGKLMGPLNHTANMCMTRRHHERVQTFKRW